MTGLQHRLERLRELRRLALERQQAQLAGKQQLCERVQDTVQRLDALASAGSMNAGLPALALALNGAAYKQSVLALAGQQRSELQARQADVQAARETTLAAAREQQVIERLHRQVSARVERQVRRREQKELDEVARQAWARRRPA